MRRGRNVLIVILSSSSCHFRKKRLTKNFNSFSRAKPFEICIHRKNVVPLRCI